MTGSGDENRWSWFCKKPNISYEDGEPSDEGQAELSECSVNFAFFLLHLLFVILAVIFLLCKRCCFLFNQLTSQYLIRWPGHMIRWNLTFMLLIIALGAFGEGFLTEMARKESDVQMQFYLPSCLLLIATVVSLWYYTLAERWKAPELLWLLLAYWFVCIVVNVMRLTNLIRENVDSDVAILWITVLQLVAYVFILGLELYLISIKICILHRRPFATVQESDPNNTSYTEDYVTYLYYITFWWMNWLFKLGFQRPLEINDLGTLPNNHRAQHLYEIFKEDFQKELEYKTSIGKIPSVWRVFMRVFRVEIFWAGVTRLIYDLMCLVGPLALNGVVAYAIAYDEGEEIEAHEYISVGEFFSNGYILIGVIFLANIIQYFSWQQNLYLSNVIGVHIRTSLQSMVYDKALRLSSYTISGGSMTVGQITNHMSTDAFNVFFFCQRLHYLWAVPFRLITVAATLYLQVDLAAFLALATILIAVPIQLFTANIQTKRQQSVMKHSDERLKQSNEMLLGMKLLKMYGWEEMFSKAIEAVRKLEMSAIFSYNGCYGINVFVVQCTPILMNLAVYASYPYITGKSLEPNTTFAALALMNLLLEPMYFVPMVTSLLVNAYVGIRRFEHFFVAPEMERSNDIEWMEYFSKEKKKRFPNQGHQSKRKNRHEYINEKTHLLRQNGTGYDSVLSQTDQEAEKLKTRGAKSNYAVKIENGDFTWDSETSIPVLKNINLEIPHGELTMVVGGVGSGKSSLLSALLGEMTTMNGSISFGDKTTEVASSTSSGIAYGAQKAWLMNATMRNNVLFGLPYNQGRYRKVIEACALKPDIDILPAGDMTEIGEKGINLSGGQKQRVSVARTMYSNKPIVLLDDPLSALDVNVGGHLFREGILGRLRKANRTVVLVTHQLQYLQQAEKIIIMHDGEITFQGTFDEVARSDPKLFQRWQQDVIAATDSELSDAGLSGEESTVEERELLKRRVSESLMKSVKEMSMSKSVLEESSKGKLIQSEELARGSVSTDTYWYYIRNMGFIWAFMLPFARMAQEAFNITRNFWLSDWSEAGLNENRTVGSINEEFVGPYLGLAGASVVFAGLTCISLVFSTWNAAKDVYLKMLRNITRAPNRFFDTTPLGRILNRFSSDTQIIDTKLILSMIGLSNFFSTFVFAILVTSIITPIVIAEFIPITAMYVVLARYFIRTSRELQRLDSVTRSPVFAHFSETLGGLTTLRAYREEKKFFNTLLKRIDTNNTAFLYLQAGYGWLGLQMNICGGFVVLVVGLTTLLQATALGNLDPSSVGLALSYVLMMSVQLFNLIRYAADVEMQMNPVERVQYYAGVPMEHYGAQLFNLVRFAADIEMQMNPIERVQFYAGVPTEYYGGTDPPHDWPRHGEIRIEQVSVRYADTLPAVLQDITVYVRPGEKVGICGRTGSGKSSLTLSLLRLIDTFKGKIIIDGEDIALMPLTTLRQRLSIIPQDPVLFTGTIRSNLDPNGTKTDQELWNALEIAQLKPIVSEFDLGLDALVSESGENFSVGQRQLFCLARAFLRNSRVLIMDEATASIDYTTEKLLQEVVSSAFKEKTVLTIAHRVSTIRESDTIWVLREGAIIECDTPDNLLANENSEYYSMVQSNK